MGIELVNALGISTSIYYPEAGLLGSALKYLNKLEQRSLLS